MPTLTITTAVPMDRAGTLIAPLPPDTWHQRVRVIDIDGGEVRSVARAVNGSQRGFIIAAAAGRTPTLHYAFDEHGPGLSADDFTPVISRFERVSSALLAQTQAAVSADEPAERVAQLMQFIADRFTYGNRKQYLGDDTEELPALDACDLTLGNCVDMHTLGAASLRVIGIRAAYVIGCFVYEGRSEFPTGHCWINLDAGDESTPHHYDISHHVEYGLGTVTPALNPKPGRRFALGIGRGLVFEGPEGGVELPSLSGFHRLEGNGKGQKLKTIGRFGG